MKQKYWNAMKETTQPTRLKRPGTMASPRMLAMVVLISALSLATFLVLRRERLKYLILSFYKA